MSPPPAHEDARPEDLQMFIEEFQKILEEAPPGYQSKFARIVAELQQKKIAKVAVLRDLLHHQQGEELDYEILFQSLVHELDNPAAKKSERFDAAFKLAQLRAEKSEEKQQSPGEEPARETEKSQKNKSNSVK